VYLLFANSVCAQIYEVSNGTVHFHSDAPQELIRAQSLHLRGAIDVNKKAFAFRIRMISFQGFNSPLQKEHFNENYMESAKYPEAVFTGKIIENFDISKDGEYDVRAKGKMQVHGLAQERIIRAHVSTQNGAINISSNFIIPLVDHDIKIPRVVYDKLAPEIKISVNARLLPRS
jgi:hypothetical protein